MRTVYLLITVDTEEDNWGYVRDEISVHNIEYLYLCQEIFDRFSIRPIYLCTWSVLSDKHATRVLKEIYKDCKCYIGAHLHPWNTPPLKEELCAYNSHAKNLSYDLIERKVMNLTDLIETQFQISPIIFRTGRWALGENVLMVLEKLGYKIDTSVSPFTNWEQYGKGQNFRSFPYLPYYLDSNRPIYKPLRAPSSILEIPVSIGFNRQPYSFWSNIFFLCEYPLLKLIKLRGILAKTGILRKIWLSPEQADARQMLSLTRVLLKSGINLLNLTFHSTSLKPGLSPFVKNEKDHRRFLGSLEEYLEGLNDMAEIKCLSPADLLRAAENGKIKCA